jgi:ketosteroid isomerase-like protein
MTDKMDMKGEKAAIEAVLAAWGDAIGAKRAAEAESYLTEDVVQYTLAPPLQYKGRDAEDLQQWFDTWDGPIGGDVSDTELIAGADVALWRGLVRMTGTKTDGVKVDLWFRQTVGLRKLGGDWKIAHVHGSVPFAMDGSGLAELGLKP